MVWLRAGRCPGRCPRRRISTVQSNNATQTIMPQDENEACKRDLPKLTNSFQNTLFGIMDKKVQAR